MKRFLTPKNVLIFVVALAAFFLIKNQLRSDPDVLATGSKGGECPVHGTRLRLDTVAIVVRQLEPDSSTAAYERANFPMANDSFYLLQWFADDEHKNLRRAEVWFCTECRKSKSELSTIFTLLLQHLS
jgi:hypothetical protein